MKNLRRFDCRVSYRARLGSWRNWEIGWSGWGGIEAVFVTHEGVGAPANHGGSRPYEISMCESTYLEIGNGGEDDMSNCLARGMIKPPYDSVGPRNGEFG